MAMAAIVAQNGATGQSLVEQFTTGWKSQLLGHDAGKKVGL